MTTASIGIVLAFAAAFSWAGADAARKDLALRMSPVMLLLGLVAAQAPVFGIWAALAPGEFNLEAYWVPGLGTLLINLGANVAFNRALEIGALSRTIPMLSLTPAITIGTAALLLGEIPLPQQLLGIVFVVVGTALLAISRAEGGFRFEPGAVMMLAVAALWSLTTVLDKMALAAITVPGHAFVQSTGLLIALLGISFIGGKQKEFATLRTSAGRVALAAFIMGLASTLQFMAIERTLVSLVETIKRAVGAGVAMAIGGLVYREKIGLGPVVGALAVVVGTALIFWP